jgi:methionine-rich copper-binding protein CopC
VDAESGNITLYKSDDTQIQVFDVTSDISGSGGTAITINPTSDLAEQTSYYVHIDATAFDDASSNTYAGITDKTTWNFTTADDETNPTVSSLSPADDATGVATTANLVITFDEEVDAESGNITLYKSDDTQIQVFDVTSDISGSGGTAITINPTSDLAEQTSYYVQIDATAFDDASSNSYAGISDATTWNFTSADETNPTVSSLSPADDATGVATTANLVITFDEEVDAESGNITLYKSDDTQIQVFDVTSDISGSGGTAITINPTSDLAEQTSYYVQIDATAFDDASSNSYAGITDETTWNFTSADETNPTVSSLSPADDATGVATTANLVITFDEEVDAESGNITLYKSDDTQIQVFDVTSDISGSGGTAITINPTSDLAEQTSYYVQIDATAFDDASSNSYAGISDATTWNFTSADETNPTVSSLSPADDATGVATTANLVITFDEEVDAESGNITLYKSDDTQIQVFDVTSDISGSGGTAITINPTSDLAEQTSYYVQIDATAFDDASSNTYAGITDETTWNFTTADETAPTVSSLSPADDATGVATTANLVITFDEEVDAESGNITLYKSDDTQIQVFDVTSDISGSGGTAITINPTSDLAEQTSYYVHIDATAFDDASSNTYAGITDKTSWNFTSADETAPTMTITAAEGSDGFTSKDTTLSLTFTSSEATTDFAEEDIQ